MRHIIHVHVYRGEKYYIAECVNLPVVTQGLTLDDVVSNIREAIALHLDGEKLSDLDLVPVPSILINMELESVEYA